MDGGSERRFSANAGIGRRLGPVLYALRGEISFRHVRSEVRSPRCLLGRINAQTLAFRGRRSIIHGQLQTKLLFFFLFVCERGCGLLFKKATNTRRHFLFPFVTGSNNNWRRHSRREKRRLIIQQREND